MATKQYGPFGVVGSEVPTGVFVKAGDTVRTISEGLVDFGGAVVGIGAPILDADGDSWSTPSNYPAPALRKNSLISKVGTRWYQAGKDKSFTPAEDGEVILRTNDAGPEDNSRGWTVTLYVTTAEQGSVSPMQPQPTPPQSSPSPATPGAMSGSSQSCGCGCCNDYYHTPPWWVTLPPWWVTMNYHPPTGTAPTPTPTPIPPTRL
jgi:hypothetical protein